ncbi:uncharacterized protein BX663DRAFT_553846 [Cokeromyces recurvatus]|uniref:uncharacterized protein n=1 Tax=Cokeromyces recurvatus TaxID=90255 RepID=UPI00221FFE6D|nr:uncharacterized protein BX663DRAFT_553846 [Cokeromyces recurvatus]KAI7900536.1 hypothetical protein BX663DRAFT_553846 [Cokeromyces recurvatus]
MSSNTNSSFQIVMDKHCALLEESFSDLNTDATKSTSPHTEVQQLLTLSNFLSKAVTQCTTKTKKTKNNSAGGMNIDSIPKADQIVKTQYRKYTETQVNELFRLVFLEGMLASEAARQTGIVVSTGQDYVCKTHLLMEEIRKKETMEVDSDEEVEVTEPLPPKERKYGNQKLFQVYSLFFLDFYEKRADANLNEARKAVMEAFPGLEIDISTISKHLKKHCNLTMKKLEKLPKAHDFDFMKNCVFIDEAWFNMNIKRTFGRSVSGSPAKIEVTVLIAKS